MEKMRREVYLGRKERESNPELFSLFSLIAASPDRLLGFEGVLNRGRFFKMGAIGWNREKSRGGEGMGYNLEREISFAAVCVCVQVYVCREGLMSVWQNE